MHSTVSLYAGLPAQNLRSSNAARSSNAVA